MQKHAQGGHHGGQEGEHAKCLQSLSSVRASQSSSRQWLTPALSMLLSIAKSLYSLKGTNHTWRMFSGKQLFSLTFHFPAKSTSQPPLHTHTCRLLLSRLKWSMSHLVTGLHVFCLPGRMYLTSISSVLPTVPSTPTPPYRPFLSSAWKQGQVDPCLGVKYLRGRSSFHPLCLHPIHSQDAQRGYLTPVCTSSSLSHSSVHHIRPTPHGSMLLAQIPTSSLVCTSYAFIFLTSR